MAKVDHLELLDTISNHYGKGGTKSLIFHFTFCMPMCVDLHALMLTTTMELSTTVLNTSAIDNPNTILPTGTPVTTLRSWTESDTGMYHSILSRSYLASIITFLFVIFYSCTQYRTTNYQSILPICHYQCYSSYSTPVPLCATNYSSGLYETSKNEVQHLLTSIIAF